MREFIDFMGHKEDLDDPKTYSYLPQTTKEVRDYMLRKIGYTHLYTNYWHKPWHDEQEARIKSLIEYYANNWRNNMSDLLWNQEQLHIFLDEVENMC